MNLTETDRLLTVIHNIDNRRIDDATVLVWHEVLRDMSFDDCLVAVTRHFRESTDYLMPAHIVRGAREIERQRTREANHAFMLESAPQNDPRPLSDRSQELRDFVQSVRDVLPPGNPDSLRYGRRYWRQVRQDRERQAAAVPNPHFDPDALARLAKTPSDDQTLEANPQ